MVRVDFETGTYLDSDEADSTFRWGQGPLIDYSQPAIEPSYSQPDWQDWPTLGSRGWDTGYSDWGTDYDSSVNPWGQPEPEPTWGDWGSSFGTVGSAGWDTGYPEPPSYEIPPILQAGQKAFDQYQNVLSRVPQFDFNLPFGLNDTLNQGVMAGALAGPEPDRSWWQNTKNRVAGIGDWAGDLVSAGGQVLDPLLNVQNTLRAGPRIGDEEPSMSMDIAPNRIGIPAAQLEGFGQQLGRGAAGILSPSLVAPEDLFGGAGALGDVGIGPVQVSDVWDWANTGIRPVGNLFPDEIKDNPILNEIARLGVSTVFPMDPALRLIEKSYDIPVAGPVLENTLTPLNIGLAAATGAPAAGRAAAMGEQLGIGGKLASRAATRQIGQELGATAGVLGAEEISNRLGIDNPYLSMGLGFLGGGLGASTGGMIANAGLNAPTILSAAKREPGKFQVPGEGLPDVAPRMGEAKALGRATAGHPIDASGNPLRRGDIVEVNGKRGHIERRNYANENFDVVFDDGTRASFKAGGVGGKQYEEISVVEPANPRFVPDPNRPTFYKPAGPQAMLYHDIAQELGFDVNSDAWKLAREIDSNNNTYYRQKVSTPELRQHDYEAREVLGALLDDVRSGKNVEPSDVLKALDDAARKSVVEGHKGTFDDIADSVFKDLDTPKPVGVQKQIDELNKIIGGDPDAVLPAHMLGTDSRLSNQAEEFLAAAEKRAWREQQSAQETADAITREARIQQAIKATNTPRTVPTIESASMSAVDRAAAKEASRAGEAAERALRERPPAVASPTRELPAESVSRSAADRAAGRAGTPLTEAAKEANWAADPTIRIPMRLGAIENELSRLGPMLAGKNAEARAMARPRVAALKKEAARLRQELANVSGNGGGKPPSIIGGAVPGGGGRKIPNGVKLVHEILAFPTALFSSNDLSYFMRQGIIGLSADPKAWGAAVGSSLVDYERSFGAVGRERILMRYEDTLADPIRGQLTKYAKDPGAYAHPLEASLDKADEMFGSRLANKLWHVRASQASAATFINELRGELWENWYKALEATYGKGKIPEKSLEKAAGAVLHFTGRGTGKGTEAAVALLGNLAFPRFQASLLQRMGDTVWAVSHINDPAARLVANAAVRHIVATMTVLGTLKVLSREGLIPDKFGVNLEDPTRADWGRVSINGLTYDPWGGAQTWARAMAMIGMDFADIGGEKEPSKWDVLLALGRGKLAPGASFATDLITEKDYLGRPIKKGDVFQDLIRDVGLGGAVGEIRRAFVEEGWLPGVLRGVELLGLSTGGKWGGKEAYDRIEAEEKDKISRRNTGQPYTDLNPNSLEKARVDIEYGKTQGWDTKEKESNLKIREAADAELSKELSMYRFLMQEASSAEDDGYTEAAKDLRNKAGVALREKAGRLEDIKNAALEGVRIQSGKDEIPTSDHPFWGPYFDMLRATAGATSYEDYAQKRQGFIDSAGPLFEKLLGKYEQDKFNALPPELQELEKDRQFLEENYWSRPDDGTSAVDYVDDHPEIEAALRRWGYSSMPVAVLDQRREFKRQQEEDDRLLDSDAITGEEWVNRKQDRDTAARSFEQGVYSQMAKENASAPSGELMDRYYSAINSNILPNGDVDWNAIDKQFTDEDRKQINKYQAERSARWETPLERRYRAMQDALEEAGYYDVGEDAWRRWMYYYSPDNENRFESSRDWEAYLRQYARENFAMSKEQAESWVVSRASQKGSWGWMSSEAKRNWRNEVGMFELPVQVVDDMELFNLFDSEAESNMWAYFRKTRQ